MQECTQKGSLPPGIPLPEPRVQKPSKRHLLEAGVVATSAAAFAISAAARKSGGSALPPQQIAELLTTHILGEQQPKTALVVKADGGHLNFYSSEPKAELISHQASQPSGQPPPKVENVEPMEYLVTAAVPDESSSLRASVSAAESLAQRVASGREASSSSLLGSSPVSFLAFLKSMLQRSSNVKMAAFLRTSCRV